MKGALARNTVKTGALLALRTATQAASLILLTHLLSADHYGGFVAACSLAIALGILPSLGAGYVMMAQAPQRPDAATMVWRYAWPTTVAAGAILLCLYIPAARALAPENPLPLDCLVWIGTSELLITPFIGLFSFALQAHNRVPASQLIQWLPLGLRALAIFPCFFVPATDRLQDYSALYFAASLLGLAIGAAITLRQVALDWQPQKISRAQLREGARYASMHLVASNTGEIDKILALRFVSSHEAGLYSAVNRIATALVMPVLALLLSAQPRIFHQAHQSSAEGVRLIKTLLAIACAWGLLSWLLLYLLSPLLPHLLGRDFLGSAALMPLLAAASLPLAIRHTAGATLVALGKPGSRVRFELAGIATLICGLVLLTPSLKINGLAIALVLSELTMAALGSFLVYRYLAESSRLSATGQQ